MKVYVPTISKTVAKLIAQVQAEAEAATLAALSAKDQIVVLHPMEAPEVTTSRLDPDRIELQDARGANTYIFRRRHEPESWRNCDYMHGVWNPAHWEGVEKRLDQDGNVWMRNLPTMVMDDFGYLVPIGASK